MSKSLTILLITLFIAIPLVALLGFHENCSEQACHVFMTNLFIAASTAVVAVFFLTSQFDNKVSLLKSFYDEEIFLPPRF